MVSSPQAVTGQEAGLPSVSVIIPTFQRRAVVCDAVAALARSIVHEPLEVIVVIDGSTDGSSEALATFEFPFPLRLICQDNSGASLARNRGAQIAAGDVLLFLDDDMIAAPDLVAQHARTHASGSRAVLGHIPLDPASPKSLLSAVIARWAAARGRDLARREPTMLDFLSGHFSVRRELFGTLGGFDETFTAGGTYGNEDLDFGLRLLAQHPVAFNGDAIAYQRYIVTPEQHVRQYFETGCADVAFARKHPAHADELFNERGAETRSARFLLRPLAHVDGAVWLARKLAIFLAARNFGNSRVARRLAASIFFFARNLIYWSGVQSAGGIPRADNALILCYHAMVDLSDDPILAEYGLVPATFAGQLDQLADRGFTFVSPDELAALISGRGRVPAKAVLLTFDDCYSELAEVAQSILQPRGIQAVAFAVSGIASGTNEWDNKAGSQTLRLLGANGLKQLCRAGIEIGCHSRTHRALPELADAELESETAGARSDLASLDLLRPRFFAYPFGRSDTRARKAVAEAGFVAGFGLGSAKAGVGSDRFNLPRMEIYASDRGWRFRLKTEYPWAVPLLQLPRRVLARCRGIVRRPHRLAVPNSR